MNNKNNKNSRYHKDPFSTWPKLDAVQSEQIVSEPAAERFRTGQNEAELSRRKFLGALVVGAATVGSLGYREWRESNEPMVESDRQEPADIVFSNIDAQELANEAGVTIQSLVEPGHELDDTFNGFLSEELLPVFHPAVYNFSYVDESGQKHEYDKNYYYDLAAKHDLPVNVIAFFASLESGGYPLANSGAATGLFQINPTYHLEGILPEDEWNDPAVTGDIAVGIMHSSLAAARNYLGVPDNDMSPNTLMRAAAIYNAGENGATKPYDELYPETQQYMHHTRRFIQVAEIAEGLRQKGYDNDGIVSALCSSEVNARAYALQYFEGDMAMDEILNYLSGSPLLEPSDDNRQTLKDLVDSFSDELYTVPLNAWLRMHTSIGSLFVLGEKYKTNAVPGNYLGIDTVRE